MKFSLVNNIKSEPTPNSQGICICCGAPTIAKCGNHKIWHWAHKTREFCDPWWENETEWHRTWKNYFSIECQEIVHKDSNTGEKHISDVKTTNNMVIEFQNSSITPQEVESRENFYKKMIWVVNGDKFTNFDKINFKLSLSGGYVVLSKVPLVIEFSWFARGKIFDRWSKSKVPVFIDFGNNELYWLRRFDSETKKVVIQVVEKENLIAKNGGHYSNNK